MVLNVYKRLLKSAGRLSESEGFDALMFREVY